MKTLAVSFLLLVSLAYCTQNTVNTEPDFAQKMTGEYEQKVTNYSNDAKRNLTSTVTAVIVRLTPKTVQINMASTVEAWNPQTRNVERFQTNFSLKQVRVVDEANIYIEEKTNINYSGGSDAILVSGTGRVTTAKLSLALTITDKTDKEVLNLSMTKI